MQTPAGTTAEGGSSKHVTRGHQALPYYEFQQQVLKSLNILRLGMQQESELLSSLVPLQTSLIEVPKLLESPLNSVEELQLFEKELTPERQKQLILELSLLGDNAAKLAVRRIMAYVLTNHLGQQYSWEGKKVSSALSHFPNLWLRVALNVGFAATCSCDDGAPLQVQNLEPEWNLEDAAIHAQKIAQKFCPGRGKMPLENANAKRNATQ
ncbi:uncharacterized protein LOC135389401 [Ornithodoros turicata]|uniref:uncharacterized protein LOC135389401 n=1 Tax=Ornithodoros turicata TaxID=34597 RepID=UPI003138F74E